DRDREARTQPLDRLEQLGELVENLLPLEAGQALQLHVEDRLRLDLRQREARKQAVAGLADRLRSANQLDDRVEMIERDFQTLEEVVSRLRFLQLEFSAPANDFAPKVDEALDELQKVQHLRPAGDDGQHDDAEAGLKRRVLVEIVEDDLRHFAALQLDDDPHAIAIRFVAQIRNAFDRLVAHQFGDPLEQVLLVYLIGD